MSITLASQHLHIDAEVIKQLFQDHHYLLLSYKPEVQQVLLAPVSNAWFTKMHAAQQYFLKTKNAKGDGAVAIHAVLIDNELNEEDRELEYEINSEKGWVKINLG